MVTEDGVVLDDGVTARIGDERYLMSTTSSGSERVRRWLEYWLQVEHADWRIALTPVTEAYAAMNVAGPSARDLLRRLTTDVDLDPEAFPYMSVRGATIAGIPECFMWRIGFTGELSYELYVPAGYGLHVWETLFEHGGDLGLRPFGVEAQRTMRIEKGHAVVGQDSDTLTGPYALGLGRLVATDKPEAVARQALDWQREHADSPPLVLVSLQTVDGTIVPPDSSQVMIEGQIVGRVTSARFSPTLDRSVALALIAPAHAGAGTTVEVRLPDGVAAAATIGTGTVQFDPAGDRLRA
jgi:sarcosine oxidase subunit alpha